MLKNISKGWNGLQAASWVICPGAWYGLRTLQDKELLSWLKPEFIPWFGFPLLTIFLSSCLFGLKGLVVLGLDIHKRFKDLEAIEKKFKAASPHTIQSEDDDSERTA